MVDFPETIDKYLRLSVAYLLIIFLFLLNVISPGVLRTGNIEVPLIIMAIYYWSAYRPTLLPLWFVFLLGILFDLLSWVPVGLNAMIFICVRWLVTDQRFFLTGQPFIIVWLGYILVSTMALMAQWALFGLSQLHWPPLDQLISEIVLGAVLFPLVSVILHATHKILPEIHGGYGCRMA